MASDIDLRLNVSAGWKKIVYCRVSELRPLWALLVIEAECMVSANVFVCLCVYCFKGDGHACYVDGIPCENEAATQF